MPSLKQIADLIQNGVVNGDSSWDEIAYKVVQSLKDPSDEALLSPGPPYRIAKAVTVSKTEGIELRRKAWNRILDFIIQEG